MTVSGRSAIFETGVLREAEDATACTLANAVTVSTAETLPRSRDNHSDLLVPEIVPGALVWIGASSSRFVPFLL